MEPCAQEKKKLLNRNYLALKLSRPLKHFSRKKGTDTREGFLRVGMNFTESLGGWKEEYGKGCQGREYADKFGVKWLPLP